MNITRLIICLLFINTSLAIRCIDETTLKFSSFQLTTNNIDQTLRNLKTKHMTRCQVHIKFNYLNQTMIVQFNNITKFKHLRSIENVYNHIETSIISSSRTSIETKINFICYNDDHCDQHFVIEHYNSIIQSNYRQLKSIIYPLRIIPTKRQQKCTIGNTTNVKYCDGNRCSSYYSSDKNRSEGRCEKTKSEILPVINIITEKTMFVQQTNRPLTDSARLIFQCNSSIEFSCNLNNCNNLNNVELIKQNVKKYYYIWTSCDTCNHH